MNNIVPQEYLVDPAMRSSLKQHLPRVIWFTGLSGSGKSTIANLVEKELFDLGIHTYTLDGDNIRSGLSSDLSFTKEGRRENLRRIAEVARLFLEAGTVVLAAVITPLRSDREMIRKIIGKENLEEIYVDTSLQECERRDVKGFYQKARAGKIENFTGISAPYEPPTDPDLIIKTEKENIAESVKKVVAFITAKVKNQ